MELLNSLRNLDLLSVGASVASICIIGFAAYFSNRKSITNRTFVLFAIVAAAWGSLNYLNYQSVNPPLVLWTFRLIIFFATWYSFLLFRLVYVFPAETVSFPRSYRFFILPITILTSIITLTPLVFPALAELAPVGEVSKTVVGNGIFLFAGVVIFLVGNGIYLLVRKLRKSSGVEKNQLKFVLLGVTLTFFLHLVFNLILPGIFLYVRFIPLGAVFTFPLVVFTAYAIFRHHLLNVKVVTTEILAFILAVVSLVEVVISHDLGTMVFRSGTFILVLAFGILLIKSVLREVEQREELQRLNIELEDKKLKLEELSRFKTQLLSLASHQVKAPLAAIKGFASILIDGLYGPINGKIKETIGKMRFSADELIGTVNNLLDLRKVEEGKMEYQFARVDLVKMTQAVVEELRLLATSKKLELTFTSALPEAFVSADETKLRQVIQNLVDNAIKYTPTPSTGGGQAGFVKVELKVQGNDIIVSIVDSGLGLPKELIPQLFEEFIRDERVKKEIRGTGLGLFIARKIVEAHSGKLWAESDGAGKGSRFYVKLKKIS